MCGFIEARSAVQRILSKGRRAQSMSLLYHNFFDASKRNYRQNASMWAKLTLDACRFVEYAMYRVRFLRHHGIEPFLVFDGGPLPAKKGTEVSRAKWVQFYILWCCPQIHRPSQGSVLTRIVFRSRSDNLEKARSLEAQGRIKEAKEAYTRCVDVTPEMAYQLIKVCFSIPKCRITNGFTNLSLGSESGKRRLCGGALWGRRAVMFPWARGVCRWDHHWRLRSARVWLQTGKSCNFFYLVYLGLMVRFFGWDI